MIVLPDLRTAFLSFVASKEEAMRDPDHIWAQIAGIAFVA